MQSEAPADAGLMPESVATLAHVLGWPAALALVMAFPGQTLDLVNDLGAPIWCRLRPLIGERAAELLHATYKGFPLYIPACAALARAERNRRIRDEVRDLERGMPTRHAVTATARKWLLTERTIWRALSLSNVATVTAPAITLFQLPLL